MPAAADEKIEVGAFVGLLHVIDVEPRIPSGRHDGLGLPPGGAPLGEHLVGDVEMQPAGFDVELDHVAVLHEGQRPPGGGFGRTKMTVLTPRSMRVETQGISNNAPFNYVLQVRRLGDCPAR